MKRKSSLLVILIILLLLPGPGSTVHHSFDGSVTDIDGNVYRTVKIGSQIWMAENLRVTRFRNGDRIPNETDNNKWSRLLTPSWRYYNNDSSHNKNYGKLYNWYVINDKRNVSPRGWHIPSDEEWDLLEKFLGGNMVAGGKLKDTGTLNWQKPNTNATNQYGFTALPGGAISSEGFSYEIGQTGLWWSSTLGNGNFGSGRSLSYLTEFLNGGSSPTLSDGWAIRCVKD